MAKRRSKPGGPDGFLVIDKPAGMTSHDVVGELRRHLHERRIGHAGTLDPDATGVLVVCVGPSTRLMRFITGVDKDYDGELTLGVTTSTLDASGEVTETFDMKAVTAEEVEEAAASFLGQSMQVPPMVSAIHVDGRRLYELAREGIEVEREPRPIEVRRFVVFASEEPARYRFEVTCSSGTYVRSLVADLGATLGGGAHLSLLRRIRVGAFGLEGALAPGEVTREALRSPLELLSHLEQVRVDEAVAQRVTHGAVFKEGELDVEGDGPYVLVDEAGLLAVYEPFEGGRSKPVVVQRAVEAASHGDVTLS